MDFLTGPNSKSWKQKVRNGTIKVTMDARSNTFEVTEDNGYDRLDTWRECQEVDCHVKT